MADEETAAWFTAVEQELGLTDDVDPSPFIEETARAVGENVAPELSAQTMFLVGLAAGRAADTSVAAGDFAGKVAALARGWRADELRGEPANDQSRRA